MIKSVVFFKRKPGMEVADFQRYWLDRHPAVVTALPGIRRYVQSHTRPSVYTTREPVYDGIAELWTDDLDALRALVKAPEYAAVKADEAMFIDGASMGGLVARDHVVLDGAPAAIKRIAFVTRRPDLSVAAFQSHWKNVHGPIAAALPGLGRYVQSHTLPETYDRRAPAYDGLAITWFGSTDAMRRGTATPQFEALRRDEPHFTAPGEAPAILTTEHVIVD